MLIPDNLSGSAAADQSNAGRKSLNMRSSLFIGGQNSNGNDAKNGLGAQQWTYYDYWIYMLAISNVMILVVVTILVSLLLGNKNGEDGEGHSFTFFKVKNNLHLVAHGWLVTAFNSNDDGLSTIRKSEQTDPLSLRGTRLALDNRFMERPSTGLFSSINSPFLSLAATVMSCAYSMCLLLVRYQDTSNSYVNLAGSNTVYSQTHLTPKMLKSLALLILVVYAVLFLFVQGEWNIPLNNMLLVEFLFMASFWIINTFSVHQKHMYFGMRLVNSVFTMPILAVCVLSMVGEDNTMNLISVYVSVAAALLLILLMNNEDAMAALSGGGTSGNSSGLRALPSTNMRFPGINMLGFQRKLYGNNSGSGTKYLFARNNSAKQQEDDENAVDPSVASVNNKNSLRGVFISTFWLCLVPFIVTCALRFHYMTVESPVPYPQWSTACLAFLFSVYILDGMGWSIQYFYLSDKLSLSVESDTFSAWSVFFKTIDLMAKYALVLLIVVGYYLEFK